MPTDETETSPTDETPPVGDDAKIEAMAAQIAALEVANEELRGLLDSAANRISELESRCTEHESRHATERSGNEPTTESETPAQETPDPIGGNEDHPPQETHWYWRKLGE